MHRLTFAALRFMRVTCALAVMLLPVSAYAVSEQEARNLVESVGAKALDVIKNKATSREQKQAELERILSTHVDVPWIGRFVLGRFWRQASEEQKTRYLKEYQDFVLKYYSARFADYSGSGFNVTGTQADDNNAYVVNMVISSGENQNVGVQYKLHLAEDGSLRIYDVVVEGVSMITTQRSEFASVINNYGLDYLISQLTTRTLSPGPGASMAVTAANNTL